ncbi:MAG TPA: histidine kinase [Terriglobales bacterium]|nr:histidine kinase [Terriglobales bacterium]
MDKLILISLLIKLGVAAAVGSALVRSREFQRLLFHEDRTFSQTIYLAIFMSVPFALGVLVRASTPNFLAADLSFEAAVLMGVVGGPLAGALGGLLLAIPAVMHAEWLSLPFNILVGLTMGLLRTGATDRDLIWSFSPFVDLNIYRWIRKLFPRPRLDWQITLFLVIIALRLLGIELARWRPGFLFTLDSRNLWVQVANFASTIFCIGIPLKIWNNTRIELKLEEQERLLLQARMEALQSQINPHFLFNTLNSVSSLVRFDPDTARELIVKLANILRRLLRKADAFVQLREEIEFIDDYLDIEVVRFGHDKLQVIKQLDPASLDALVPSMVLQPLVENSIKHGLGPKIEGGSIVIRSALHGGTLVIQVQDDGVGMSDGFLERPTGFGGTGIGMANVSERLRVLYGDSAKMVVNNNPSGGTLVELIIPIFAGEEVSPAANPVQAARSSTLR